MPIVAQQKEREPVAKSTRPSAVALHASAAAPQAPAPLIAPLSPPLLTKAVDGKFPPKQLEELNQYIAKLIDSPTKDNLKKLFEDKNALYILYTHPTQKQHLFNYLVELYATRWSVENCQMFAAAIAEGFTEELLQSLYAKISTVSLVESQSIDLTRFCELILLVFQHAPHFFEKINQDLLLSSEKVATTQHNILVFNLAFNHFTVKINTMYWFFLQWPSPIDRHEKPSLLEALSDKYPVFFKILIKRLLENILLPDSTFNFIVGAARSAPGFLLKVLDAAPSLIKKVTPKQLLLQSGATFETSILYGLLTRTDGLKVLDKVLSVSPNLAKEIYSDELVQVCSQQGVKQFLDANPLGNIVLEKIKKGNIKPTATVTATAAALPVPQPALDPVIGALQAFFSAQPKEKPKKGSGGGLELDSTVFDI